MKYFIKHELPGRIRFGLGEQYSEAQAVAFEETLLALDCVCDVVAYPKAGYITVQFCAVEAAEYIDEHCKLVTREAVSLAEARARVCACVGETTWEALDAWKPTDPLMLAPRPRQLFFNLARMLSWFAIRRIFMPSPLRTVVQLFLAFPFFKAAWESLTARRLDVPVLDAAAIGMGFLMSDGSAGSTMLLLRVGETLEDYTQRRSESSLAQSLLDIPTTAHLVRWSSDDDAATGIGRADAEEGEQDIREELDVPISALAEGDIIVVRLGDAVPVDGHVIEGSAEVNQASLTGESMPVTRTVGDSVFAGTAVEEGEIFVRVGTAPEDSKVRSIVNMVESSNNSKSAEQMRIESAATKLVPYNFALAAIVALVTRDLYKTASTLMVDYSCALKLSGSVAVMSAQREGANRGFMVKGSLYFQRMAEADTIVFDKTGTLTAATPVVTRIDAFGGRTQDEVLALAACLEEHFPHPVARAVVNAAFERGLKHRELHAEVDYIVAHGITTTLHGKRVVIGSQHFVVEDEGVEVPRCVLAHIEELKEHSSPLFLAMDSELIGVLFVDDPIKPGIAQTVDELRGLGFKRVIMLTGDNAKTAAHIAAEAGIDEYRANLLPEDKLAIVEELQAGGAKVCMVGDGVNDSPALAAAHVSVAMSNSSAIARETADIALVSPDTHAIVDLRKISKALTRRMHRGYRFTIGFNSLLLALGIAGVLTPQTSSLLHNGSTVALSALNSREYLPQPESEA
jgi:heavy metal translocating P-type ATPase